MFLGVQVRKHLLLLGTLAIFLLFITKNFLYSEYDSFINIWRDDTNEVYSKNRIQGNTNNGQEAILEGLGYKPSWASWLYFNESSKTTKMTSASEGVLQLNVTSPEGRILIYNRVPKCGSTSLWDVIQRVSKVNNFKKLRSKDYFNRHFYIDKQAQIIKDLLVVSGRKDMLFDRHMYYFNTERSGSSNLFMWMNFVRDPVDRFISFFYFKRTGLYKRVKGSPKHDDSFYKQDLNECIHDATSSCLPEPGGDEELQLTYFCGHHPECRKVGSRWALEQAQQNVEKHYSVVGVLEELSISYQVLEHILPRFFKNLTQVIKVAPHKNQNLEKSAEKSLVKNETRAAIKARLKEDIEFYSFLKQRLYLQNNYIRNQSSS